MLFQFVRSNTSLIFHFTAVILSSLYECLPSVGGLKAMEIMDDETARHNRSNIYQLFCYNLNYYALETIAKSISVKINSFFCEQLNNFFIP